MITKNYLTYNSLLKAKIFGIFERFFESNLPVKRETELYGPFIETYDEFSDLQKNYRVGLAKDTSGTNIIVRDLSYKFKNLKYEQIFNEAKLLEVMSKLQIKKQYNGETKFPALVRLIDRKERLILMREYISGKKISQLSAREQKEILKQCLNDLSLYSQDTKELKNILPKRGTIITMMLLPIYSFRLLFKEPSMIGLIFKLTGEFYKLRFTLINHSEHLVLANRDLHQDNIIISKGKIKIIDSEISALAEPQTDLAIIARYYLKDIGEKNLIELIKSMTGSKESVARFLALSIFYTLQNMMMEEKNNKYYIGGKNYLQFIAKKFVGKVN